MITILYYIQGNDFTKLNKHLSECSLSDKNLEEAWIWVLLLYGNIQSKVCSFLLRQSASRCFCLLIPCIAVNIGSQIFSWCRFNLFPLTNANLCLFSLNVVIIVLSHKKNSSLPWSPTVNFSNAVVSFTVKQIDVALGLGWGWGVWFADSGKSCREVFIYHKSLTHGKETNSTMYFYFHIFIYWSFLLYVVFEAKQNIRR